MGLGQAAVALVTRYSAANFTLLWLVVGIILVFFGLIIAELGLVIWLSAAISRLQHFAASAIFFI